LIVVSHDRYLVERICDTTMAILPTEDGSGELLNLAGGIDEYLARRRAVVAEPRKETSKPLEAAGDAAVSKLSGAEERAAKKELQRLERQIAKLEQRETQLHGQLAEHATDYSKIAELDAELRTVRAERESAEEQWLELGEQL
jgi:ATP-binding cassette subfamily F protein uup